MNLLKYSDFEIRIDRGNGDQYPVAVLHSPAGEGRGILRLSFDESMMASELNALQTALVQSTGRHSSTPPHQEGVIENFGKTLFRALFADEIRSLYYESLDRLQQDRGLRIKLRIEPPELAALPWEFLYDLRRPDYVCLSSTTPIIRYLEMARPVAPLLVTPPLRILGIVANPRGLELDQVKKEQERLEMTLEALRVRGLVTLEWIPQAHWRGLQKAMQSGGPWHILHLIGHGGFDRDAGEGVIALVDEAGAPRYWRATQLCRLLADHRSLRLVVLNACEGARGNERDVFSSTAASLVRRGIPAVLAMQYVITETAAVELSRSFYEAIATGFPIDAATAEARKSMSFSDTFEWGVPTLFTHVNDGQILRVGPRRRAPQGSITRMVQPQVELPPSATEATLNSEEPDIDLARRVLDWLHVWGFEGDPFASWAADQENNVLPYTFVDRPYLTEVLGNPARPQTTFLIGRPGSGKSAAREMVAYELTNGRFAKQALPANYCDFTALLGQIEKDSQKLPIRSHVRAIARSILARLAEDEIPQTHFNLLSAQERILLGAYAREFADPLTQVRLDWLLRDESRPVKWEELSPTEVLGGLARLITHLGASENQRFEAIYVLIDRTDETALGRSHAVPLLKTLVTDTVLLSSPLIAFKFFVSNHVWENLQATVSLRHDRFHVCTIQWDVEALTQMINARLAFYSTGKVVDFGQLCAPFVGSKALSRMITAASNSPRGLLHLCSRLVQLHVRRAQGDLIDHDDISATTENTRLSGLQGPEPITKAGSRSAAMERPGERL